MHESRRAFLGLAFSFGAASAFAAAQQQMPMPDRPVMPEAMQPYPFPKRNPKAELQANQERIKKDVLRLSQLVKDLQNGLDSNDTRQVLSIDVMRKAEEIEKLAKRIRESVRG